MPEPTWASEDGQVQLYLGDCLDVLPTLAAGSVDAVVTDPPYGINLDTDYSKMGNTKRGYPRIVGDDGSLDLSPLFDLGQVQVVFGADNFYWQLPPQLSGWLCWDKRCSELADRMFGHPFELAWVSKPRFARIYRIQHGGAVNADGANQPRLHPTQKPVALMTHILQDVTSEGWTVLDPFMGSGTTGVACVQTGRRFIGVEIEEKYFNIAVKRIQEAKMQLRMELL